MLNTHLGTTCRPKDTVKSKLGYLLLSSHKQKQTKTTLRPHTHRGRRQTHNSIVWYHSLICLTVYLAIFLFLAFLLSLTLAFILFLTLGFTFFPTLDFIRFLTLAFNSSIRTSGPSLTHNTTVLTWRDLTLVESRDPGGVDRLDAVAVAPAVHTCLHHPPVGTSSEVLRHLRQLSELLSTPR